MGKELPILMSTAMVQATLDGRKTQTRRVVTANNTTGFEVKKKLLDFSKIFDNGSFGVKVQELESENLWRGQCKWQADDLLYVRESWRWFDALLETDMDGVYSGYQYRANTPDADDYKWKPSIHMPKEASRIWLRVKEVKLERVRDISEADAIAEGIAVDGSNHVIRDGMVVPKDDINWGGAIPEFANLWNRINAKRGYGWDVNPYVWVVKYEVVSIEGRAKCSS